MKRIQITDKTENEAYQRRYWIRTLRLPSVVVTREDIGMCHQIRLETTGRTALATRRPHAIFTEGYACGPERGYLSIESSSSDVWSSRNPWWTTQGKPYDDWSWTAPR